MLALLSATSIRNPAEQSAVFPEQLTPYDEAAKAIFIKANGGTAYERGLRFAR
ncbi:MAG: hypothetical protein ACKVQQ_05500 [Burkholderiales bacterium]